MKYLANRYVGKPDDVLTFRLRNGQRIKMTAESRFMLNEMYLDKVYEVPGFDWSRCKHALDLGANIGLFALYASAQNPSCTIHCFEPAADNFALLEENIATNRVNAKCYRMAVAGTCGSVSLERKQAFNHRLSEAGTGTETVECVDLSRVFTLCRVKRFDLAKIDIEGSERAILATATDDELCRLGAISLEWHHTPSEMEEAAGKLRGLGLQVACERKQGLPYLNARSW